MVICEKCREEIRKALDEIGMKEIIVSSHILGYATAITYLKKRLLGGGKQ